MDLATILDDCVHRMRGGESVEDCLADYPEQAAELAPMLHAASALEWLAGLRLPDARRQQTRTALRQAVAASQAMPKRPAWMAFWVRPAVRALAGVAAVLVFLTFAITTVAASRPGDLAYPARVMAERSTLLLQCTPDGQASASLRLANNRLSELEAGLALPGRAYDPALDALLHEDKGLADLTLHMPAPAREQVARQVAAHAGQLEALAQGANEPQVANALRRAAVEANVLAESILEHKRTAAPAPGSPTPAPQATPAAKAPGGSLPAASASTQGASVRSLRSPTAPSIGTLSKRGVAAGPAPAGLAAASTSSASPLAVPSPLQRPKGWLTNDGPRSWPPAQVLPPSPGPAPTAEPMSPPARLAPPTRPAPLSPAPSAAPASPRAAPPAMQGPGLGRLVSPPAIAPESRAPHAPGPATWAQEAGKANPPSDRAPAAERRVPAGKQKGGATGHPTQSVHSTAR